MTTSKIISLPQPHLACAGPTLWRVEANVEGIDLFIEAPIPLLPRAESLVCPFLFPAMLEHADLEVAGTLDSTFQKNLVFVRNRATEWWPELGAGEVHAPLGSGAKRGTRAGFFFTGGIDSSYVLQQLHPQLRYAVFVEGFDIGLWDRERLDKARAWLKTTTEKCGMELVVVRTNLREHPLFSKVSWEITHVAALAAVAHALGEHVDRMHIAASDVAPPWGSAPELDAAWSSASMELVNYSAELTRLERVRSLAHWEPIRGRLRVCWANRSSELNCGFCEKCVRTRMQLFVCGAPDGLDSFPAEPGLSSVLGRLDVVQKDLHEQWREISANLTDRRLQRQIEGLLKRSNAGLLRRIVRRLKRIARRLKRVIVTEE